MQAAADTLRWSIEHLISFMLWIYTALITVRLSGCERVYNDVERRF